MAYMVLIIESNINRHQDLVCETLLPDLAGVVPLTAT